MENFETLRHFLHKLKNVRTKMKYVVKQSWRKKKGDRDHFETWVKSLKLDV